MWTHFEGVSYAVRCVACMDRRSRLHAWAVREATTSALPRPLLKLGAVMYVCCGWTDASSLMPPCDESNQSERVIPGHDEMST